MATELEQQSKGKVHAVLHLLDARHVSAPEMHHQLVKVYEEEVMSYQCVVKWCSNFNSSQVVAMDNVGSDRPTTLAVLQVDNLGKSAIQTRSCAE
jgi:hypothetical protein